MRLIEIRFETGTPVDGYGPGFYRIGGVVHRGSVLILPGAVTAWGGWADRAAILAAAGQVDVVFVGTGATIAHAEPAFARSLDDAGIGVEVMASPAACRTYNVLLSEGRRIGLALFAV